MTGAAPSATQPQSDLDEGFDDAWYLDAYPDVRGGLGGIHFATALEHYQRFGKAEGRAPSAGGASRQERVGAVWSQNVEEAPGWYWMAHPRVRARLNLLASGDPGVDSYGRLADVLQARGTPLPIPRAVSLGCGFGGMERDLAARGTIREIDAYDIAPGAVAEASRLAREAGFDGLRYHVADLETEAVAHGKVDVVFAHQSVHHVERLEPLFAAVSAMLRPGGVFHLHEFVGPIRFQWTDAQIGLVNRWLDGLPPRLRALPNGRPRPPQGRATVGAMIAADPSEAVRSSDILPVLRDHFDIIEERPLGGALLHLGLAEIAQNFDEARAEDRDAMDALFAMEDRAMADGTVGTDFVVVTAARRG